MVLKTYAEITLALAGFAFARVAFAARTNFSFFLCFLFCHDIEYAS
jgi:hypothetical protein